MDELLRILREFERFDRQSQHQSAAGRIADKLAPADDVAF